MKNSHCTPIRNAIDLVILRTRTSPSRRSGLGCRAPHAAVDRLPLEVPAVRDVPGDTEKLLLRCDEQKRPVDRQARPGLSRIGASLGTAKRGEGFAQSVKDQVCANDIGEAMAVQVGPHVRLHVNERKGDVSATKVL
jgi:hypothetical protein